MMNDKIIREFKDKAVNYHDIILFHGQDAIKLVEKCRELKINILGIDAFELKSPGIQPRDYFDYTGFYDDFEPEKYFQKYHVRKYSDSGRWADAIQFVKDRIGQGWLFEISYEKFL